MANHKSALKRVRQTVKRSARNTSSLSSLRTHVKSFHEAVDGGNKDEVANLLRRTSSLYDQAAQCGIIHRNKAARAKASLVRAAKSASAE